jgi:glycosyltransferase involved in cell wall biosynthesis
MTNIAFLTIAFPFEGGEQFIENEINIWGEALSSNHSLTVLPLFESDKVRNIPNNINLNTILSQKNKAFIKLHHSIKTLFSSILWKELTFLIQNRALNYATFLTASKCVVNVLMIETLLTSVVRKYDIDTVYCYWNDYQAYASLLLKRKGVIKKVYSRCHNYDLYEERRPMSYMPFKRQVINELDRLFVICDSARTYAETRYGVKPEILNVSRLGVNIPNSMCPTSDRGRLNLLSLSYCVKVKRVDKIIDAIKIFAKNNPSIAVVWTHVGGGAMKDELYKYATEALSPLGVNVEFAGELKNKEVLNLFETHEFDLFINTSEFEGVPVSIMEAMSYGVPVIAPDVGGISEILDVENNACILVPEAGLVECFAAAISKLSKICKEPGIRQICREKIKSHFNSAANYSELMSDIINSK